LDEVLQPAIRLAEEGCPVADRAAVDWAAHRDEMVQDEGARLHLFPGGRAPRRGEVMAFPALAKTLRLIAAQGRDAFYLGEIATDLIGHLRERGSLLTAEDFARTQSSWVEPIGSPFMGREVLEIPPNGQGIAALIALNILGRFDLGRFPPESVERRHLEL